MVHTYSHLRIKKETMQKVIKVRAKIEIRTGERCSLEKAVNVALDAFLHT